ncbi:MAG: AMP-binding protein [Clostridia bacterium]|nr:AMP-binding protein [Clostridia bacterium]
MKKGLPTHLVYQFDNLYDGVVKQAARYGDKDRYVYKVKKEERHFTYNDMLNHVNWLASAINTLGLREKYAGVTGETHPHYVATYLSVVSTGGVIVPLDKEISAEQFVGFVNLCELELLVYTNAMHKKMIDLYDKMPTVKYIVCIDFNGEKPEDPRFMTYADFLEIGKKAYEDGDHTAEETVQDRDKLCTILFTSGTTGTSKGVMLCQRNLVTAAIDSVDIIDADETDSIVSVLPVHHAYEFTISHLAAPNIGITMFINDSIKNTLRNFAAFKPTVLILVPLYLETMQKKIWAEIEKKGKTKLVKRMIPIALKLPRAIRRAMFKDIIGAFGGELELIVSGGAPLRPELIREFDAFGIKVCEGYGITECAPLISCNPMHWRKIRSAGLVVRHMEARIDKEDPADETGEIVTRGDAVMLGYYKNPEATAEVFTEDGWFRTGDIGYLDKDNFVFITGRKKNVIIASNGKNVFPEELEEYLGNSEWIAECAVIGRKDANGDVLITALIYPDYDKLKDKTAEEIKAIIEAEVEAVNKNLPTFKHIGCTEIRETEFEKNTSRKIMRYKLK